MCWSGSAAAPAADRDRRRQQTHDEQHDQRDRDRRRHHGPARAGPGAARARPDLFEHGAPLSPPSRPRASARLRRAVRHAAALVLTRHRWAPPLRAARRAGAVFGAGAPSRWRRNSRRGRPPPASSASFRGRTARPPTVASAIPRRRPRSGRGRRGCPRTSGRRARRLRCSRRRAGGARPRAPSVDRDPDGHATQPAAGLSVARPPGQCRSSCTNASCARSSAAARSRTMRVSVRTSAGYSTTNRPRTSASSSTLTARGRARRVKRCTSPIVVRIRASRHWSLLGGLVPVTCAQPNGPLANAARDHEEFPRDPRHRPRGHRGGGRRRGA